MQNVILQLQNLQQIYTQLQTSISAQQHHLSLLLHILQTTDSNTSNSFILQSINNLISSHTALTTSLSNVTLNSTVLSNAINQLPLSTNNTDMATKQTALSNTEEGTLANHLFLSNNETGMTTNHLLLSKVEQSIGTNHLSLSNAETSMATKQIDLSNADNSITTKQADLSSVGKGSPTKQTDLLNIEETLDISRLNNRLFKQQLATLMPNCSNSTKLKTIIILTSLYKNPKQTHQALIQLTQLSKGGLNKHLITLKKRNLIVRVAYQEYKPTSFILNIMKQCMQ